MVPSALFKNLEWILSKIKAKYPFLRPKMNKIHSKFLFQRCVVKREWCIIPDGVRVMRVHSPMV